MGSMLLLGLSGVLLGLFAHLMGVAGAWPWLDILVGTVAMLVGLVGGRRRAPLLAFGVVYALMSIGSMASQAHWLFGVWTLGLGCAFTMSWLATDENVSRDQLWDMRDSEFMW